MIFFGAPANSPYSMLGLGNVENVVIKKTIYVSFVQKLLWYFCVKLIKFAQTWKLLFDGHQLLLVSKLCKNDIIDRVAVKINAEVECQGL